MPDTFGNATLQVPLWPHQERALAAFEAGRDQGRTAYLVIPPGGGKTLIGLEAARRAGRPALVLCPNTAIQAQWIGQWAAAFAPPPLAGGQPAPFPVATARRDLPTPLTVLTYQAVASFEGGGSPGTPPDGRRADGDLLGALHPNGQRLIAALAAGGPWTLVLDECHHLLEVWGRLLAAIVAALGDPLVIGLTATPPHLMTSDQAALHQELFGAVDLEVSAPALVRDGRLAPYQELAWFTTPTPAEADYIGGQALRFAELRAGLLDPGFAGTPFLAWLQQRVVERPLGDAAADPGGQGAVSWERFARDSPALADAALRLHGDGLLPLPAGATPREQHRRPPDARDWVALIGDYSKNCLLPALDGGSAQDRAAFEAIRAALPSIGYRLTRAGVRAAESPVDRVLARSQGKALAAVEILRAERAELGGRLRALVLTDYAQAGGTVPAALAGVQPEGAGGARLALAALLGDEATAALDPVLLTGQRVACGAGTAARLADWLRAADPALEVTCAPDGDTAATRAGEPPGGAAPDGGAAPGGGIPAAAGAAGRGEAGDRAGDGAGDGAGVVVISGGPGWEPRRYVPLVTRFFTEGGSRCLVGTRALLGEGWDAPAVNVTVDLTAATTPTAVVQARGRALRRDAAWPQKVADNWAVVCVTSAHPKGGADYDRFVRKHDRYFALAGSGDIASGVSHVDAALSPFEPPGEATLDEVNARMLARAGARDEARERWRVGAPYADEPVATVTVTARRPVGLRQAAVPAGAWPRPGPAGRGGRAGTAWLWAGSAAASLAGVAGVALGHPDVPELVLAANPVLVAAVVSARAAGRARRIAAAPASGSVEDMAAATADALHAAGLASQGSAALRVEPRPDGSYRARLADVPAGESATFAAALEEVLSPLAQPRYLVPRLFIAPPGGAWAALRLARRRGRDATVVYHAVPAVLGANARLARLFARAWNARVSPGELLYAGSPEGAGILAAQRGDDPFALTTQIRTLWR